jgi:glycosyltransferase involved in cell wall biosynthesis
VIVILEPMRVGMEHQAVNAGLTQAVCHAMPGEKVLLLAERLHLNYISELLPVDLPVQMMPVNVAPRSSSLWQRLPADFLLVWRVRKLITHPANYIIFSSVSIPLFWALRLIHFAPVHCVIAVIHSGLAELRVQPRFNLFKRWTSFRWALTRSPSWLRFIVLEQSIHQSIRRYAPDLIVRFDVLPHPLPIDVIRTSNIDRELPQRLTIGMLGLATPQKGLFRFLELAETLKGEKACFQIVGRIHESFKEAVESRLSVLELPPESSPMPRPIFIQRIQHLTYAAFFFEGGHYSLTASGVLLDCIALGIPLLGYRHPMFSLLEAEAGEIGYFCETGQEVELVRSLISHFDLRRYQAQCRAMQKLRDSREPQILGKKLSYLMKSLP